MSPAYVSLPSLVSRPVDGGGLLPLLKILHWSSMPTVAAHSPLFAASISGLAKPSNCGRSFTSILHTAHVHMIHRRAVFWLQPICPEQATLLSMPACL